MGHKRISLQAIIYHSLMVLVILGALYKLIYPIDYEIALLQIPLLSLIIDTFGLSLTSFAILLFEVMIVLVLGAPSLSFHIRIVLLMSYITLLELFAIYFYVTRLNCICFPGLPSFGQYNQLVTLIRTSAMLFSVLILFLLKRYKSNRLIGYCVAVLLTVSIGTVVYPHIGQLLSTARWEKVQITHYLSSTQSTEPIINLLITNKPVTLIVVSTQCTFCWSLMRRYRQISNSYMLSQPTIIAVREHNEMEQFENRLGQINAYWTYDGKKILSILGRNASYGVFIITYRSGSISRVNIEHKENSVQALWEIANAAIR